MVKQLVLSMFTEVNDPIAHTLIIAATFLVSILAFNNPSLEERYLFRPESVLAEKEYYRLVTSGFLHANWAHLLLNMYTLYVFGAAVELWYGSLNFVLIYFASIVGGNLVSLYLHRYHDYAAYGASGGVCGLVFAYVLRLPYSRLSIFPLPYAVPGWLYAIAFMVASFYALKAARDNIGHDAHLGGAIIGLLTAASLAPELAVRHWPALAAMVGVAAVLFAYLYWNPMFLPLSAFIEARSRTPRRRSEKRPSAPRQRPLRSPPEGALQPPADWLLQELEVQVGKLEKDKTGAHQWVDKFGRTYDLLSSRADQFDMGTFTAAVRDRLKTSVSFVVVDTGELKDSQVALLRPFFADLPDAEFNRIIRSYALKS
jgi:membrane associated rhomboid family serine protease